MLKERLERLQGPLVWLAVASVASHLAWLQGVWASLGVEPQVEAVLVAIDFVFLADFAGKIYVGGRAYLTSGWCLVDGISTLPILSTFSVLADSFEALRVLRCLRYLRSIRALRLFGTLRTFRILQAVSGPQEESPEFGRTLAVSVVVYSAAFLALMAVARGRWPDAADPIEFFATSASLLGMGVAMAIVRAQSIDAGTRELRSLLNIALPHQVADHFMKHPDSYDTAVSMPATVLFSDVHGFSETVETMEDLAELKRLLERILDAVVDIHVRHDLIVDKFIGDAVMSFRGGDLVAGTPEEHALRVVRAALESTRAIRELDNPKFRRMKIGGASAASCLIGTFGTSKRVAYTALGDVVNLAARLEPVSGRMGTENLFCDQTQRLTEGRAEIVWRRCGRLRVAGRKKPLTVFEALGPDEAGAAWLDPFQEGMAAYEGRDFAGARRLFEEADRRRPGGDRPAVFYARLCEGLEREPPAEGWEALIDFKK